jgi:hypothetical protein
VIIKIDSFLDTTVGRIKNAAGINIKTPNWPVVELKVDEMSAKIVKLNR